MLRRVARHGFYVTEDIHSSCQSWIANEPARGERPRSVGGTASCMRTKEGKPTFFHAVVGWQRQLASGTYPSNLPGVQHIDVFKEAVVFEVG